MSNSATNGTFDAEAAAFQNYQDSPWGQLLHKLSIANVHRHLDEQPHRLLRILDVGGGTGIEGISFASNGHTVTVLDPSGKLLDEARKNAHMAGVSERMIFCEADLLSIPELFEPQSFDVILCHNVLQYIDTNNLTVALQALCHPLVPGGFISAICINRYSEAYRMVLQQLRPDMAYTNLTANTIFSGVFKINVHAYIAAEMCQAFEEVGCVLLAQYGLRCVNDYISDNSIKSDPAFLADLERLEYGMSPLYPYYLLARFFQLVVRKPAL